MQSGRVVQLARRLSVGDTCIKNNLSVNQPFCRDYYVYKVGEFTDSRRFYRLQSSSVLFPGDIKGVSFLLQKTLLLRTMASTSPSDKDPSAVVEHPRFTNRLSKEKSPYLLQHAQNPVDWYPWGDEAIEKAKKENKLIFLSVGYSTCHWCHVMEHESFENEVVASIMNEHFVNVKVDREERPDIDKIYMTFIQATSARGGWPMSVFLTPDLNPVTGGTYFPVEDRWGRPGFKTILLDLANKWKKQQLDFMTSGEHILEVLKKVTEMAIEPTDDNPQLPNEECWTKCVKKYIRSFDKDFGGFGGAPKFPQISNLDFLFHVYARSKKSDEGKQCLEMCLHTLKKMAYGGIHDHISNGFARYSVDGRWHVPHFEKMLYDQSQLCMSYVDAYLATKDNFYLEIVKDIITYVCRDLSNPNGGFYSAEDADSLPTSTSNKKKEGAFCVWTYNEVQKLLDGKQVPAEKTKNNVPVSYHDIFCYHFNVLEGGNTDTTQDRDEELLNQNVLIIFGSSEETAEKFGLSVEDLQPILEECKTILYSERQKRPRPHLDTKILCSWNGLMLGALAKAGQAVGENSYIERAVKAAHFIRKHLYLEDQGLLLRSCYRGQDDSIEQIENPITGFLDDYAFLIKGLLELYEASFDYQWLEWASQLQDKQDELFWDSVNHAYFTSPEGASSVILRLKEDVDGAEPSGNSVSVHNLLRLSALGGGVPNERLQKAEETLLVFSYHMSQSSMALPEMMSALMFYLDSPTQIFIAGNRDDPRTQDLLSVVRSRLLPGRVLALVEPEDNIKNASSSIASSEKNGNPVLKKIRPIKGVPAAYVCRHHACSLPVTKPEKLEGLLE